jgi:hypothetical protein
MSQPPLELESPSAQSYMVEQPDVFGMGGQEQIPDFGVDPYAQADAATPYFDQRQEIGAQQPEDIELQPVIGGRPRVTRTTRIQQLRSRYRDLAGVELDPTIERSTYVRQIEPAIRELLLREYTSLGGANPQVLKSKKIGLIESELKNLKDANSI